jgi:hypothetical protein
MVAVQSLFDGNNYGTIEAKHVKICMERDDKCTYNFCMKYL